MDYKNTLNLTLSDKQPGAMQQRGNLPQREPEIQAYWDSIDLYKLSVEKPALLGDFVLHDGPPYSNGDIHLGHALNKIAKDIIVKFRTMQGYRSPYVPGWDNHGMPIENEVAREFRARGAQADRLAMRRRCRSYAAEFVERQKVQFKRLGVRGDWDHPYITMAPHVEAGIVEAFGALAEKGYIYRGLKPVLWCASCETALADAEVEYSPHTSRSIVVRFPIKDDPNLVFGRGVSNPPNSYALIWTTTPWTIPANLALAVHPDSPYQVVELSGDRYLVAEPRIEETLAKIGNEEPYSLVWNGEGARLEGVVAAHPLFGRDSPVVVADYVTMTDGTGVVHTAPGHGKEDFETGVRYGLEPLCPVDPSGVYTAQAGDQFAGARILTGEADQRVIQELTAAGHLLSNVPFEHSYPHCWRCHSPLIFRATVQWFMNIDHDGHRERCLNAIDSTSWYPAVSINRIRSMVANRPDWCLSRQRSWGVGIPAFYCTTCDSELITPESVRAVAARVAAHDSDVWFAEPAASLLPPGTVCSLCGAGDFRKETDILDVWFDSGSTHHTVLGNHATWPLLRRPADIYLEGSDQHRGWFNSSLMVGVGMFGDAPYLGVITNGWTLDETGKAMHKSLGNAVAPTEVIEKYGADILRLWVASTDYFEDVRCSDGILKQVAEAYRRIRNTFRFMVNNLHEFQPHEHSVPVDQMLGLDQWALAALDRLTSSCGAAYNVYEFHRVFHAVHNFCGEEMSAFYLDVLKDRLYCDGAGSHSRRSAQTALYRLCDGLARILAPVLSHTCEEVWGLLKTNDKPLSVQLANFPLTTASTWETVLEQWAPVLELRASTNIALETLKQSGAVTNTQEAHLILCLPAKLRALIESFEPGIESVFKVSQISLGAGDFHQVEISAEKADGLRCDRCWLIKLDVGTTEALPALCGRCADVVAALPVEDVE